MSARDSLAEFCVSFAEEENIRPTAAEVFRAGFNPGKARPRHTSWFEFLRALGQLSPAEEEVLEHAEGLLDTLETESITKSYKLVTLQAMASLGGLTTGVDVVELGRSARAIMERDPRLMRDIEAGVVTPDASEEEWARYWRKWAIAALLGELRGRGSPWFRLEASAFRIAIDLPERLRDTFAAMVSEIVEYRLARYLVGKEPLEAGSVRCRVSHKDGQPLVRVDRRSLGGVADGEGVLVIDGRTYHADFGGSALGSVRELGKRGNALPSILRGWFGPSAGLPGTSDHVILERAGNDWTLRADRPDEQAADAGGTVLPMFPTYKLACGAFLEPDRTRHSALRRSLVGAPAGATPDTHFITFAWGDSMNGGRDPIRHGDMLLMQWLQKLEPRHLVDQVVLVQYRSPDGDISQALKQLVRSGDGPYLLKSANPGVAPIAGTTDMQPTATLVRRMKQSEFNPLFGHLFQRFERKNIPALYGETFNVGNWNSGHVSLDGRAILFVTLQKSEDMVHGSHYEDRLVSPDSVVWSSQSSTTRTGKRGRELLESLERGIEVHVWLRRRKSDGEFIYCGMAAPGRGEGEKPIRITWRLYDPLPPEIYHALSRA